MILILDGPEKAGKTTLVENLKRVCQMRDIPIQVRHWGKVPSHRVYAEPLYEDAQAYGLRVWDRSWASEVVYGQLLGRERELAGNGWLAEWTFGRAVDSVGFKVMMLGPSPDTLESRRTPDDLPVSPKLEQDAFRLYAETYGWTMYEGNHNYTLASQLVRNIYDWQATLEVQGFSGMKMPVYVGPTDAPVVLVGEARNTNDQWGGMFPFGSHLTMRYGRALGNDAFKCGWTNTDANPDWLRHGRQAVIACGKVAAKWCRDHGIQHALVPHPAWLYRYGIAKQEIPRVEKELTSIVAKGLQTNG